jgi:hypothetical protein
MNFIEQLFGLSPDAGTGLTEMVFLLVPLALIVVLRLRSHTGLSKQNHR